jgi:hypothetical protein
MSHEILINSTPKKKEILQNLKCCPASLRAVRKFKKKCEKFEKLSKKFVKKFQKKMQKIRKIVKKISKKNAKKSKNCQKNQTRDNGLFRKKIQKCSK